MILCMAHVFLFGRLVDVFDHFLLDTLQAHHRKASYLRAWKVCYLIINGEWQSRIPTIAQFCRHYQYHRCYWNMDLDWNQFSFASAPETSRSKIGELKLFNIIWHPSTARSYPSPICGELLLTNYQPGIVISIWK